METPEHDKMMAVKDKSEIIGEFLDWMFDQKGFRVCEYEERCDAYFPCSKSINTILASYFDIDLDLINEEKEKMLEEIRKSL
jgi:hypothetical protein